jgi:glycosyltransferase involved in cell wall biosynthesis
MCLLSVIIPVYNNVTYISSAIENYLSQHCLESELIVIDGGSNDGTKEVIEGYAKENPSIKWISEKDFGQSDAMNKGIGIAEGKYISFLNVDDYYSEGCLNEVCGILNKNPSIKYLVGNCKVWDKFGELIYINRPSKVKKWEVFSGYHFSVNPTAYFYLKSLHDQVGYYSNNNHYNMDLEMILRFREVTNFHYYAKEWGNFRLLPNAKTFEDQESNQLEQRKDALIKSFVAKQTLYIKLRVFIYRLRRTKIQQSIYFIRRFKDKIKYEFTKMI